MEYGKNVQLQGPSAIGLRGAYFMVNPLGGVGGDGKRMERT